MQRLRSCDNIRRVEFATSTSIAETVHGMGKRKGSIMRTWNSKEGLSVKGCQDVRYTSMWSMPPVSGKDMRASPFPAFVKRLLNIVGKRQVIKLEKYQTCLRKRVQKYSLFVEAHNGESGI